MNGRRHRERHEERDGTFVEDTWRGVIFKGHFTGGSSIKRICCHAVLPGRMRSYRGDHLERSFGWALASLRLPSRQEVWAISTLISPASVLCVLVGLNGGHTD